MHSRYFGTFSLKIVCAGLSALFLTGTRFDARAGSVCCGSHAVCEWTSSDRRDIYFRDFDGEVFHIHWLSTAFHVMARLFCLTSGISSIKTAILLYVLVFTEEREFWMLASQQTRLTLWSDGKASKACDISSISTHTWYTALSTLISLLLS
jgi:hypothetical protein